MRFAKANPLNERKHVRHSRNETLWSMTCGRQHSLSARRANDEDGAKTCAGRAKELTFPSTGNRCDGE